MSKRGTLVVLAVLLALMLPGLFRIAWPFLTSFLLASILAIVINPANQWLNHRVHRPGLATLLITFATVFLLGIIVAFAGFVLSQELTASYNTLSQRSLEEGGWPALVTHSADRVVDILATRLPLNKDAIRTEMLDAMRTVTGYLLNNVGTALGGVTSVLITEPADNRLSLLPATTRPRLDRPADRSGSARSARDLQPVSDGASLGRSQRVRGSGCRVRSRPVSRPRILVCGCSVTRSVGRDRRTGVHHSGYRQSANLGAGHNCLYLHGRLLESAASRSLVRPRRWFRRQRAQIVRGRHARQTAPYAHRAGGDWRHVRIWRSGNSAGSPAGLAVRCIAAGDSRGDLDKRRTQIDSVGRRWRRAALTGHSLPLANAFCEPTDGNGTG